MERDILTPEALPGERAQERVIRPQRLAEFVGQKNLKEQLSIYIEAARKRGGVLDHVLFHGQPGLGKTTLATIISQELGVGLKVTAGPILEKKLDLAAILNNLNDGDVVFIDEIHRLSPVVEEVLYPAMEDFRLDLIVGEGPGARSVRLEIPRFTLVGATTRVGLLTPPLRDRFGIQLRLNYYEAEDLVQIVSRAAAILNIALAPEGAREIAVRSRGTPRVANRILNRTRDFAEVKGDGVITREMADLALSLQGIDKAGLDELGRRILLTIVERYRGGPVGLEALAATIGEEAETLIEIYEPYLIQEGFLLRTPRGRIVTPKASEHLGLAPPETAPSSSPLVTI
ncbi:MAG: Holliday junction branch migration DNA helicase RuvB [Deltaproteobacteria bacterium]|jgi:Holliday junction DNA helicase RuvB|nr:Holliday junction branch migration DNA helicase RuvB [Deltaproteobacteria bacterium]